MKKLGIYVHTPFCKSKCKYCDFISFAGKEDKFEDYYKALEKEISEFDINKVNGSQITSIYFGGGTPSYPNEKNVCDILKLIKERFKIDDNVEITIEINPGTVNKEKLLVYKDAGFNRLSIGLQSTEDRLLKLIGRIHTYEEFLNTYNLAKEVGFENINVDLMLALPTQTKDELIDSLNKVIALNPNHISIYSLILEEGTELEKLVANNELSLQDEDTERKMYWITKKILEKNKYVHYEISNFSKKGCESNHNMDCWNQEEYLGFGVAAHSYLNDVRYSNVSNLDEYISNCASDISKNKIVEEEQTSESKKKEYMMIGFRKINGISISEFERKFRINPLFYFRFEIEKLVNEGLIEVDLDNIKLTKKGLDLANLVFEEFI